MQVAATPQIGFGAAFGLFYNPDNWLFAEAKNDRLRVLGAKQMLADRAWKAGAAHLRVVNQNNHVTFLASKNRRDWQVLVGNVDVSGCSHNALHGFQCLRPALAASGMGKVHFIDFGYRAL